MLKSKTMDYRKYDYWFLGLGCVCLLTFLAIVFLCPKDNNADATPTQVMDKKMLKEDLDDLSQKLDTIRQELLKQEESEKRSTR